MRKKILLHYYEFIFKFYIVKVGFKYVSSMYYQRESKIYLFSFLWMYNDLYVITSHKFISLKTTLKQFWH
jgi:hypothetical protein